MSAPLHFVDHIIRCHQPSNQNGRKQGNERHHHTIANVVHDIEKLSGGAIWKLYLKIENTISQLHMEEVPHDVLS